MRRSASLSTVTSNKWRRSKPLLASASPHARIPLTALQRDSENLESPPRHEAVFQDAVRILQSYSVETVWPCLSEIDEWVQQGFHAVGFVSYEAAPAFDSALTTNFPPADFPLVWFGIFRDFAVCPVQGKVDWTVGVERWETPVSEKAYLTAIERVKNWIRDGDTYQVNFTYPLEAHFHGNSLAWYRRLQAAQFSDSSAFIDTGRHQILCASPELFFQQEGDTVTTCPMKGTAQRGLSSRADRLASLQLRSSEKERAENVMIVDLLRNDLGRIATTGSVAVDDLFVVTRFDTLWQMTSTVTARSGANVPQVMAALFPCGSVTGAPKVRTMQIIREVEECPRGVYCGAIGWWGPGRRARFSVPIRTVVVDTKLKRARFHVGSGIVADSEPARELEECAIKTRFLFRRPPRPFGLLETLSYNEQFAFLDEHMGRLAESADYFGFHIDPVAIREQLLHKCHGKAPARVRLTLGPDGKAEIDLRPPDKPRIFRLALCPHPVDPASVFLYHKTTNRTTYEAARHTTPQADDIVLWNTNGEVTETTIANLVIDLEGELVTPPVECGLLPGVMRQHLLTTAKIVERRISRKELLSARHIWLVNSVRGWIPAKTIEGLP